MLAMERIGIVLGVFGSCITGLTQYGACGDLSGVWPAPGSDASLPDVSGFSNACAGRALTLTFSGCTVGNDIPTAAAVRTRSATAAAGAGGGGAGNGSNTGGGGRDRP